MRDKFCSTEHLIEQNECYINVYKVVLSRLVHFEL